MKEGKMKMNESAVTEKILKRMPIAIGLIVIVLMFVGSASASCSYPGAGDWVIESWEDCIITDETIVLDGNLTINGNLTFKSVTLKVNANYNGSNKIEVTPTGSFKILDYNGAPSNITTLNNNCRYLFWVDRGAKFLINNSELHGVGYNYTTPDYKYMGLWINTNTSIIENSTISKNYYGLTIYNVTASSNPGFKIFGTTFVLFENRNVGIFIVNTQNVWVVGNTITAPIGMAPVPRRPIIFGIGIWHSNNNWIIGNSISLSPDDGINLCDADNNYIIGNHIFMITI
jgi:parallel beta-helix repeat protein